MFWRTVLPESPLPVAILRLLPPDTYFVGEAGANRLSKFYTYDAWTLRTHVSKNSPFTYYYHPSTPRTRVPKNSPFNYYYHPSTPRTRLSKNSPFNYYYHSSTPRTRLSKNSPFNYYYHPSPSTPRISKNSPFLYNYHPSPPRTRLSDTLSRWFGYTSSQPSAPHPTEGDGAINTTVFFHETAARVGQSLLLQLPAAEIPPLGLLPRHVANSIPFSKSAFPDVLAQFGVPAGSVLAADMKETLDMCEAPLAAVAEEAKFCATSLEALVEGAMAALGTRNIRPVTSTLPRTGAPLQPYTIRAVRPVAGSRFVACHDMEYPYTVYMCHGTGPARVYMLDMEGVCGGSAVTVAAVCHTDTSRWKPEHVSFKLLGTKPGGEPVCHIMPYGHIVWVKNASSSSSE